jgi:hypothetical protein
MTTSEVKAKLLTALEELSHFHPDWRLGQTMANLAMAAGRTESSGVWDLEDEEALVAAQRLLERHREYVAP